MTRCQKIIEFQAHTANVNCLVFSIKSRQIVATGGEDQRVNLWRVTNAASYWSLAGHTSAVDSVCFDPRDFYVASGSRGGTLKIYDLEEAKVVRSLAGHMSSVTCLEYHPYGEFLLSGSVDTNFKLWDLRTKKCIVTYKGHTKKLTAVKFCPDGTLCAASGEDGLLTLWDLRKKEVVHTYGLEGEGASIRTFEFNSHDMVLAAATSERVVRLWDATPDYSTKGVSPPEPHQIRAITYDLDTGDRLYCAGDGSLRVVDGRTGALLEHAETKWDRVAAMTATEEGQVILGAMEGTVVTVWAAEFGQEEAPARARRQGFKADHHNGPRASRSEKAVPPHEAQRAPGSTRSSQWMARDDAERHHQGGDGPSPPARAESKDGDRVIGSHDKASSAAALPHPAHRRRVQSEPYIEVRAPTHVHGDGDDHGALAGHYPSTAAPPPSAPPISSAREPFSTDGGPSSVQKSDDEVILSILLHRSTVSSTLSSRLSHLQILSGMWRQGNGSAAFGLLRQIHDNNRDDKRRLTVVADFLRVINLRADCVGLESAILLLPVLNSLLTLDFENHVVVGLRSIETLLSMFGRYATQVRCGVRPVGVDLAREERLRKCEDFHQAILHSAALMDGLRRAFKTDSPVHDIMARVDRQLREYLQ